MTSDVTSEATAKNHFVTLDGYRGIAAILVTLLHLLELIGSPYADRNFALSVDFFFMLSGFVIGLSYEKKLQTGAMRFLDFVRIRLIRLYPMIFIGALIGIAWRLLEARFSIPSVAIAAVFSLLLLPLPRLGDVHADSYPVNGPGWSLTHELLVNFLYALVVRGLTNRRLAILMLVAIGIEIADAAFTGSAKPAVSWASQPAAFFRALAPFLIGVALFRLLGRTQRRSNGWSLLGAMVVALALSSPFVNFQCDLLLILLAFPAIIWIGTHSPGSQRIARLWTWLGGISYPLYAINHPLIELTGLALRRSGVEVSRLPSAALVLVLLGICLALAHKLQRLYDEPVRFWLKQRIGRSGR